MKRYSLHCIFFILLYTACKKDSALVRDVGTIFYYSTAQLDSAVEIGEIYHTQNFAAFTDLTFFNGSWYSVFRVGTAHTSGENGEIKILNSPDGLVWKVMDIISINKYDLRDPKLTIDSMNNNLYLSFFGIEPKKYGQILILNYLIQFNKASNSWGSIEEIQYDHVNNQQFVLWRLCYHKGNMYCAGYCVPLITDRIDKNNNNVCLFISDNSFSKYKSLGRLDLNGVASETTIRFNTNDSMYLLTRTETINSPLGISTPSSYKDRQWLKNPLFTVLASPNFLFYKNKLLITGRDSKERTFKFFAYNLETGTVEKTYTFPSGHETGYSGMSYNPLNKDEIWITYYSVENNASNIMLAKIDLLKFL